MALSAPTPTPSDRTLSCASLPARGFGKVWSEQGEARALVGCPSDKEVGALFQAQRFERGVLIWQEYVDDPRPFPPRGTILILFNDDHTAARIPERWDVSMIEPLSTEAPPLGLFRPSGRFGVAWREDAGLRARLGWAIEPPRQGWGAWQGFTKGEMIWSPFLTGTPQDLEDRWIYVVSDTTRWLAYRDTFGG